VPCDLLPPFPTPPPLPPGMSVPVFPGLVLPSIGLCCKIQVPPWGAFPVPAVTIPVAFPAAVIAAYAELVTGLQLAYDAVAIPCPTE
jgi:hypothetical protein